MAPVTALQTWLGRSLACDPVDVGGRMKLASGVFNTFCARMCACVCVCVSSVSILNFLYF